MRGRAGCKYVINDIITYSGDKEGTARNRTARMTSQEEIRSAMDRPANASADELNSLFPLLLIPCSVPCSNEKFTLFAATGNRRNTLKYRQNRFRADFDRRPDPFSKGSKPVETRPSVRCAHAPPPDVACAPSGLRARRLSCSLTSPAGRTPTASNRCRGSSRPAPGSRANARAPSRCRSRPRRTACR
jgi:hypothetical protein